ncbi:MFS transporter [Nitrososphaera sp.]|uniref:MFS transporter n=1 Tax=Nitrososphaera sp. TaxID=1971748 RepID=UPI002ED824D6
MDSVEKQDTNRSGWRTLIILSCLGLIVMFDETMILPAIPDFIRDFHISYSTSSWLLSSYLIAAAVMTPIAGRLSDIYGKKKILLIVMAVYTVGVLSGRFATNIEFMLAARAAQGVGMAMFPIAFGIIREVFPEKKLTIGQTIFSSTFSGGAVIGLVGGAAIIQNFGWQATFLAILPVAIALWLIIVRFVRVQGPASMDASNGIPSNNQTVDMKGTLTLAATIISFLVGITFLESNSASAGYQVAGLFATSGVLLAVFIAIEKRVHSPLLNLKLMTNKLFLPPTIILLLVSMSIFMVYLTIPVLVRSPQPLGFGGNAVAVASVQLPFMVVLLIGTIMSGFILNKVKNTRLTLIGTVISAIGFFILFMFHATENMVSVGLAILAAGLSLSMTGAFNVILLSVPMQVTGIALGMTLLLNLVGMSVGPALAGVFQQMNQGAVQGVPGLFPTENAYNLIFVTAALVSLSSVAMALSVARRKSLPAITSGDQLETGNDRA